VEDCHKAILPASNERRKRETSFLSTRCAATYKCSLILIGFRELVGYFDRLHPSLDGIRGPSYIIEKE
jgi:hypothetical protein